MDGAHDAAILHGDDALAAPGQLGVVGDEDERGARPAMQRKNEVHDLSAGFAIEISGRLVGEQDFGLRRQRPRKRDALLLAA